ncbi:hypothetical protein FRB99_007158 [Tulasnella sp. 403]|nr:hypothetical protein FRB99_007158 [Tulasnella sp. 403]
MKDNNVRVFLPTVGNSQAALMYGPKPRTNLGRNRPNGPRTALIGSNASTVPPAWKATSGKPAQGGTRFDNGSKIFISGLPLDVGREAIAELMDSTVGPLKEAFCVYDKAGKATGMAVVHFSRSNDAARARALYNHKIIDQRRPIKVELIGEPPSLFASSTSVIKPSPPSHRSLFDRIKTESDELAGSAWNQHLHNPRLLQMQEQRARVIQSQARVRPGGSSDLAATRLRRKKGPKRLQKTWASSAAIPKKTVEELDREIDEYRRGAPPSTS